jgi:class 3 adenylate cyclase/tetratricopeptide (TPR) repeat protein
MTCASCDEPTPPNARFCPACGAPGSPAATLEERKLVTVIFCDLMGSTPLSEALDPETLRGVVLRYFTAMRRAVERFHGTVEKFIGDAVMAVFGVPVMHEDDARRAALAALAMLDGLAALNKELEPELGVRLRVRIGVHTGLAVTSGDSSTRQALVSGETVNIAARLEQNAGEDEILIGPLTREAIGAARVEAVGPLRLKGKEAPVSTYRLLGLDDDGPAPGRGDLPFVGRQPELRWLRAAFAGVAAGDGARLLTISGDAGIGKTRLVRDWLADQGRHGSGRCRPYGDGGSLAPLGEAVGRLFTDATVTAGLDPDVRAVLDAGLLRDGTPGISLDGTRAALATALETVSRTDPVVLVIDDCHAGTDPFFDTVEWLVGRLGPAAVLVVCVARPDILDRRPAWADRATDHLTLGGLPADDVRAIVAARGPVPARLIEAAGGNPHYLEQLLAVVGERGVSADLPHGLQALLGARLDALPPAERRVLDLAAVLGGEFAADEVRALADGTPDGVPGEGDPVVVALDGLGRRGLVVETGSAGPSVRRFRFGSGLVHEVAYQAMAKRTRADRHARAAGVLGDRRASYATVAHHLERAYRYRAGLGQRGPETDDLRLRSAQLLTAAGSAALARSDLGWARGLLRRATRLFEPGEPGSAAATRQLGEVAVASGNVEDGLALLRRVVDAGSDAVETAHARLALATADRTASAAEVARQVLPTFAAARDYLGQARARIRLGQERQLRGRHGEADDLLSDALAHARRCDAEPELALALGTAGISLWRGPTPVPFAVARCNALLAQYGRSRPTVWLTLSCPLAVLLALDEQWEAARERLARVDEVARGLDYAEGRAAVAVFRAVVEALAGNPADALAMLDEAAGPGGLSDLVTRDAARLLADLGRPDEAAARLARADDPAHLLPSDLADLDGLRARLAAARGAAVEAVDLAARAVSTAATTDSPIVRATAALDQAHVLRAIGRADQAAAAARAARELFRAKGHLPGVRAAAAVERTDEHEH